MDLKHCQILCIEVYIIDFFIFFIDSLVESSSIKVLFDNYCYCTFIWSTFGALLFLFQRSFIIFISFLSQLIPNQRRLDSIIFRYFSSKHHWEYNWFLFATVLLWLPLIFMQFWSQFNLGHIYRLSMISLIYFLSHKVVVRFLDYFVRMGHWSYLYFPFLF